MAQQEHRMPDTEGKRQQRTTHISAIGPHVCSCCHWVAAAILIFGLAQQGYSTQSTAKEVVLGVFSHHGPAESLRQWSATADYLTEQIPDCSFTILPFGPYDIDHVFSESKIDFVISCPSQYIAMEVLHGAMRITTMKTKYAGGSYDIFSGVIFWTSGNAQIHNGEVKDLKGKKVIGTHGRDCAVWHAVSRELIRYGFSTDEDTGEVTFAAEGEEIVSSVRDGTADVGIIRSSVYDKLVSDGYISPGEFEVFHKDEENHAGVPFVHSTTAYPERVLAKLRHVNDSLAEKVMTSLIRLPDQHIAAQSAKCGGWTVPHNYQTLRECLKVLKVRPYEDYGRITIAGIFSQYKGWIISIAALAFIILAGLMYIFNLNNKLVLAKKVIVEREIVGISDRTQKLIGQTLHDTIGQNLTGIRFLAEAMIERNKDCGLQQPDSIELISDLASKTITQTRELSKELYPVELSREALRDVVVRHLHGISQTFGIKCRMEWPVDIHISDPDISLHVYRIIQESIHNSIKHGKAKRILVRLEDNGDSLRLRVQDDGIGLPQDQTDHRGMGLHLMKYRAGAMHGSLVVCNNKENGVVVECSIPRDSKEQNDVGA